MEGSMMFCGHANEVAQGACTCGPTCACRTTMCFMTDAPNPISDSRSQAAPTKNELPFIKDLVIQDIQDRAAAGYKKYGVMLQPHNGRDPLIDAYQELLDGAKYLRQALYEKYGK